MRPAPVHLAQCTEPRPEKAKESQYAGHVRCQCGGDTFEIQHTGAVREWYGETIPCVAEVDGESYLHVVAKCAACGTENLLFDKDIHGWEGVMYRNETEDHVRQRPPLVPWKCPSCGGLAFSSDIVISGDDAKTVIADSGGILDEKNWQEGFGWIDIDLHCAGCGNDLPSWISYESM